MHSINRQAQCHKKAIQSAVHRNKIVLQFIHGGISQQCKKNNVSVTLFFGTVDLCFIPFRKTNIPIHQPAICHQAAVATATPLFGGKDNCFT